MERSHCFSCGKPMSRAWAQVLVAGQLVLVCSDPCIDAACLGVTADVTCEHCGTTLPPDDRVATKAGGNAHAGCALRATVALGLEQNAVAFVRLAGPAFARRGRA